jgi:RNA polymerase sigma-54 factor
MFQRHYQVLRPLTTAHLAQTMTLLSLTVGELRQQIDSELASNPALELVEERRCPTCHRLLPPRGACPVCSCPSSECGDEPVVFISPREDFYPKGDVVPDGSPDEDYSTDVDDLPTYVLRQIASELAPNERRIAAYLLTNLDEDGLLSVSLFEVARYFHVTISDVEDIQRIIQRADPIGVGSNTPRDALLVQLELLSETRRVPDLARRIIQEGMELMSRRQYVELARLLKTSSTKVQQAINFISENLNPFPARSHWGDVRQPGPASLTTYHQPDIIISYLNDDPSNPLMVEIIMPLQGTLRINPLFRSAMRSIQASTEKKEEWKSDLERASLFVKCLQQRNHTMQRLIQRVVALQKGFIINGERHLVPVTRARLSQELEVHESTISRAVANKTVQLPNRRIIPFSAFFDRSLNVRTVLKDIIAGEASPLSDSELAELLAEKGFSVARRTVAKYRAMEGILPAHLRTALA